MVKLWSAASIPQNLQEISPTYRFPEIILGNLRSRGNLTIIYIHLFQIFYSIDAIANYTINLKVKKLLTLKVCNFQEKFFSRTLTTSSNDSFEWIRIIPHRFVSLTNSFRFSVEGDGIRYGPGDTVAQVNPDTVSSLILGPYTDISRIAAHYLANYNDTEQLVKLFLKKAFKK